jgi:hypothetical protein
MTRLVVAVREHVGHAARHAQVVFEDDEAAILATNEIGAGHGHIDAALHRHTAHLAPEMAAALDQLARDHSLREDPSVVVHILQEQVDGREPLGQAALEGLPFRRRDQARDQVEREDPLGALLVAVDGERDALGEKRLVGLELQLAELPRRGGSQFFVQREAMGPHLARAAEHLVVGAMPAVGGEQIAVGRPFHGRLII